jgi:hypothetical protein
MVSGEVTHKSQKLGLLKIVLSSGNAHGPKNRIDGEKYIKCNIMP